MTEWCLNSADGNGEVTSLWLVAPQNYKEPTNGRYARPARSGRLGPGTLDAAAVRSKLLPQPAQAGGCPACCALTGAEKHCQRCQDEGKVPGSHATLQPNDAKGYFEPPHRIGGVLRTLRRAAAACPEGPVPSSSSKRNRRYHSNSFDGFRDHQIPFAEQYDRGTRHRRMRGVEDCSASKPRRRV